MSVVNTIHCRVRGLRSAFGDQQVDFRSGIDLRLVPQGPLGPKHISDVAADLLDFAAAVFQIERQLSGRQRTNPPDLFQLHMRMRRPEVWTARVSRVATDLLGLLGNATWELQFKGGNLPELQVQQSETVRVKQVMLLSGGLDSTCGAACLGGKAAATKPVSFYTRQKALQREIAAGFALSTPSQWRMVWEKQAGRGHSFFYRSFLFLSLAAVTATTWGARTILQFENGILATAIPPAPSWLMTKHAHPQVTALAAELFSGLLGGGWTISNPFLTHTKRECVEAAMKTAGSNIAPLLEKTETCWYHWSNRLPGGKKTPGIACGVCIPCILRRTALPGAPFEFDLRTNRLQNHPQLGRAFRCYYGLLSRVLAANRSNGRFYAALPAAGRDLLRVECGFSLEELHRLFTRFAEEFMETYGL